MPAEPQNLPLLQDSGTPALGGEGESFEPSPLEELIAKSTSEQATANPFFLEEPEPEDLHYVPANQFDHLGSLAPSFVQSVAASVTTLLASILCLLQMGLVWASFLSEAWFETHLTVTIDWNGTTHSVDQLLQSTTLASMLQIFIGAEQNWASTSLLITALILPCLSMMLCAAWIVGDHQDRFKPRSSQQDTPLLHPRRIFEYLGRLSFIPFFSLCILDMGTSSVELVNNHSAFSVTNQTKSGLVCYVTGVCCSLAVIVVLRHAASRDQRNGQPTAGGRNNGSANARFPPAYAFQLPWQSAISETERQQRIPLLNVEAEEDENLAFQLPSPNAQLSTPPTVSHRGCGAHSFCQKVIIYETVLLATILWFPAMFPPLFRVHYSELVSSFMEDSSFVVRFWELPGLLLQRGVAADTDFWILVILGSVLLCLVYILPILATMVAIFTFGISNTVSSCCQRVLWLIHPWLCGVVFAIALFLAIPAFGPIGDYILNSNTSGFCEKFQQFTNEWCLVIEGEGAIGMYFLLAQAVVLEFLMLLALQWKR